MIFVRDGASPHLWGRPRMAVIDPFRCGRALPRRAFHGAKPTKNACQKILAGVLFMSRPLECTGIIPDAEPDAG